MTSCRTCPLAKKGVPGCVVADMLRVVHGIDPRRTVTLLNKRVDTGGVKFADPRLLHVVPSSDGPDGPRIQHEAWRGVPVAELITKRNMSRILKASVITDGICGLEGSWGAMDARRRLASSTTPRYTMHRRHVVSVRIASQMTEARSQREPPHPRYPLGVVCPIESPDNKDIGLTKHFAVMAHVTVRGCLRRASSARCWTWGDLLCVCRRRARKMNGTPVDRAADPLTFDGVQEAPAQRTPSP
jgi:hypothetical protein